MTILSEAASAVRLRVSVSIPSTPARVQEPDSVSSCTHVCMSCFKCRLDPVITNRVTRVGPACRRQSHDSLSSKLRETTDRLVRMCSCCMTSGRSLCRQSYQAYILTPIPTCESNPVRCQLVGCQVENNKTPLQPRLAIGPSQLVSYRPHPPTIPMTSTGELAAVSLGKAVLLAGLSPLEADEKAWGYSFVIWSQYRARESATGVPKPSQVPRSSRPEDQARRTWASSIDELAVMQATP
jgi:hypothetical protein